MSQIMETVLATEKTCDERVKAARAQALETAAEADRMAERIVAAARERAKGLADEIAARAQTEAEKIAADGRQKSDEAAKAMLAGAQVRFDAAVKAVASTLLKIS